MRRWLRRLWRRGPNAPSVDHRQVAELIRTTARNRSRKLAKIGLTWETVYERVWMDYCLRQPRDMQGAIVPFKTAQETIRWISDAFLKVEEAAAYNQTVAAHG